MKTTIILLGLFREMFLLSPAWAWFAEGHQGVGIIAADDLTPSARSQVAQIDTGSVKKAGLQQGSDRTPSFGLKTE